MRKLAIAVCLFAVFVGACGNDDDPTVNATPQPTNVTVTATDYAFADAPATIAVEHLLTLTVKNDGTEEHEAAILQLNDGKTVADIQSFFGAPSGPPPFVLAGGTTGTAPGTSTAVTQALPAGSYAFICYITSPSDQRPHFTKGMLKPFTVTGNSTTSLPLPEGVNAGVTEAGTGPADASYTFEIPALKAGTTTVRFSNSGKEDHVLGLARVADGKTAEDALNWLNNHQGPPPLTFMGGPAAGPGGRNSFEAKLSKGTYVFYCPVPVTGDPGRTPHYSRGMFESVTIT